MAAFVGFCILAGCALIAWSVFFVGRRIARTLFSIGIILETNDERRREMESRLTRL